MIDTTQQMRSAAETLSGRTTGSVDVPGADGYDRACSGYQLRSLHRPELVVHAADEQDVVAAVRFAARHQLRLAVQARGHGRSTGIEGGVLIGTAGMSDVRVDARAGTAWVEAGATWARVIAEAAPHGLAPPSGSFTGVGAVSYTLGGGVGLLARRYGFAADHVRRIDVVTPDGRLRRVTASSDAELFWALRGGGGNFGVVTGMEIDLLPVERFYGGSLSFDVERVPDVLDVWRRWTRTVPEELTSAVSMLPFPDVAGVPESLRGRHVAQIQVCYLGSTQQGQRWVEPLRALGGLCRDTLGELAYSESGSVFDEPDTPHAYLSQNSLVSGLDRQALAALTSRAGPAASAMCVVGLRHLGGAMARPAQPGNAVGHRDAEYSVGVLSPVEPGGEGAVRAVQRHVLEPLRSQTLGPCLNFSFGPLDEQQVRSAFAPEDYCKLTEVKARCDPDGMVHCNHAIPSMAPDGVGTAS